MLCVAAGAAPARAETPAGSPSTIHILDIDSDDADDQADALTAALRSRARGTAGWRLADSHQSSSALFLSVRCPPHPDGPCLERAAARLKTDRFIWGTVQSRPNAVVAAELHLWARGRPDVTAVETFSSNLKDPSDESLRRVAARIVEKLGGVESAQVLVTATTADGGAVYVDGQAAGALEHGQARVVVTAGPHTIEVRAPGYLPSSQPVEARGGAEVTAPFQLQAAPVEAPSHPVPTRKVITWVTLGVGAAALVGAVIEGVNYLSINGSLDTLRKQVPSTVPDVCSDDAQYIPNAVIACRKAKEARTARDVSLALTGLGVALGATGVILLATEPPARDSAAAAAPRAVVSVIPHASPWSSGVDVHVRF